MTFSSMLKFARSGVLCVMLMAMAQTASAQNEGVAAEFYGLGVHDYFAGRYLEAHENLTTAIAAEKEAKDARMFYFRGLTYLQLGRADEAQQDFEKAAALESASVGDLSVISRSLERIQGQSRIRLERHRAKARVIAHKRKQKLDFDRFENERARRIEEAGEGGDPFAPDGGGGEQPALPDGGEEKPAPDGGDPFGGGEEKPAPDGGDPFGGGEEKPAPDGGDPFGGGEEKPAPDGGGDPFGGGEEKPAPDGGDPFGGGEEKPAPGGGDPFGGGEEKPAPGGAEKPAAGGDKKTVTGSIGGALLRALAGDDDDDKPADAKKPGGEVAPAPLGGGGGEKPIKDPFGGGDKKPDNKPAAGGGDPFGGEAAKDPFGGGDAAKPADKPKAEDFKKDPFADDADQGEAGNPFE